MKSKCFYTIVYKVRGMEVFEDVKCKEWMNGLKKQTAETYKYGLRNYCEHTKMTPTALIDEAREDYNNRVAPWELRHVKRLEDFIASLDNDMANNTKKTNIKAAKSFYNSNKIPIVILNYAPINSLPTERYMDIPLLKVEDIRKAVFACGTNKLLKALILTFFSSGQGQKEVQSLKGKHLKNIVNGVAIVNITRGKTGSRHTCFISGEAVAAIREYKPNLKDDDYIFTQTISGKPLYNALVNAMFARHAEKLGWNRSYFAPHRFRHFFKTQLTEIVDSVFVEFWMGHTLKGVQSSYFIGQSIQHRMLEAYMKNLNLLTVFTPTEVLQKEYDDLKQNTNDLTEMKEHIARLEKMVLNTRSDMLETVMSELNIKNENLTDLIKLKTFQIDETYVRQGNPEKK